MHTEEDSGIYLICILHSLGGGGCVAYNAVCCLPIKENYSETPALWEATDNTQLLC